MAMKCLELKVWVAFLDSVVDESLLSEQEVHLIRLSIGLPRRVLLLRYFPQCRVLFIVILLALEFLTVPERIIGFESQTRLVFPIIPV